MNLTNFIKKAFNKVSPTKDHNEFVIEIGDILPEKYDKEINIPEERIVKNFDPFKPSILIIDDSKGIISIVEDYILECGIDKHQYNILSFYGIHAPFVMQNTLTKLQELYNLKHIDLAIIDVVLPGKIKKDDKYIKMDGVDVSIWLNKHFSLHNFCFYTGNVVNNYVDFIQDKTHKFNINFNKNMQDYIIFKGKQNDEETIEEFCKLLNKEKYVL